MEKGIVLSVDDDADLQFVIKKYLEVNGYTLVTASSGRELTELLKTVVADVILLDLKLPDADGINLIQKIKDSCNTPIIVLSGISDTTEKVVCLEMGADDYLTKPFELRELSARIKALLRRAQSETGTTPRDQVTGSSEPLQEFMIQFGRFKLDQNQFQVFDETGGALNITTGEFQLLATLANSPNRVLSRDFLYSVTRDSDYESYDRAIDIQIGRIRKKLGAEGARLIKTVRGVGYMFTPQVDNKHQAGT